MSIPLFCSFVFLVIYAFLKYIAYRACYSRRPTWGELWRYSFEDDVISGRNARAFVWLAAFFLLFSLLVAFSTTSNPIKEGWDVASVMLLLKMVFCAAVGFNLLARQVIYEEEIKGDKKFTVPLLELVDVARRTPWVKKGTDMISISITVTTLAMLASLGWVLYLTFIYKWV